MSTHTTSDDTALTGTVVGNDVAIRDVTASQLARKDCGATTAEYAITTLAACGFAALLVVILKSDPIRNAITSVITTALKIVT